MHYWLHRISHENGYEILDKENILTIGFSKISSEETLTAFLDKNWAEFNGIYCKNYPDLLRNRVGLWRFAVEMQIGDIVVVPYPGYFKICRIAGEVERYPRAADVDLGWQRKAEVLAAAKSREGFCSAALLSRMKTYWTNADVQDLQEDVEQARIRIGENKPFDLSSALAEKCLSVIREKGSPYSFEALVEQFFRSLGANARVMPKNYSGKQGDCDIEALFPSLNLIISVQVKFHNGQTDDWSVTQIMEYANEKDDQPDLIHWQWVITSADGFTPEAQRQAKENHVRLIAGPEFAKMLVEQGISSGN